MASLFTIGHSTHPLQRFVELLKEHRITAVCDVRSTPYSRRAPQFNREPLKAHLSTQGIAYLFLGSELGGRASDPSVLHDGQVQYDLVASTTPFQSALERLREGSRRHTIALMRAEADPLQCHRMILVARHVSALDVEVFHILGDGTAEPHAESQRHLLAATGSLQPMLFESPDDLVSRAYRVQGKRIAYKTADPTAADIDELLTAPAR